MLDAQIVFLNDERSNHPLPGINATIGVVATNASLTKSQARVDAISKARTTKTNTGSIPAAVEFHKEFGHHESN